MSDPVSFDPRDRFGRTDELWGNLALPEGSAEVDTRFVFAGNGDTVYRVSRINVFPQDSSKRLYYYLRATDSVRPYGARNISTVFATASGSS